MATIRLQSRSVPEWNQPSSKPYLTSWGFLRDWIITAFCKRVTSQNPPASKISTFYSAVFLDRFHGVLGAGRRINTVRADTGRDKLPVNLDQTNQYPFHKPLTSILLKCYEARISAEMHSQSCRNFCLLPRPARQR